MEEGRLVGGFGIEGVFVYERRGGKVQGENADVAVR